MTQSRKLIPGNSLVLDLAIAKICSVKIYTLEVTTDAEFNIYFIKQFSVFKNYDLVTILLKLKSTDYCKRLLAILYSQKRQNTTEAVFHRCSSKLVFLKCLQCSQDNT